jgi:hypothetical protein
MISFIGAGLLVAGVIALLHILGLYPRAIDVVRISKGVLAVMSDPHVTDSRKELLLRKYSLSLLRSFLDISLRAAGTVGIPLAVLWMLEFAGILSLTQVVDLAVSWPFLLGSALAVVPVFWISARSA